MKYEDFVIRIDEKSGDFFKVSIDSPAGSGQSQMRLPYTSEQLAAMLRQLGDTFRGSGEVESIQVEEVGGGDGGDGANREMERKFSAPAAKPTELGKKLFESLLTGDARTLFNRSVGRVQSDDDVGLRIKLQLNTKDPAVAQLASLPWEMIWSPEEHEYLNLIGKYPMVRYLSITQPDDKEPISLPLRILVVMSNPKGVAQLNLAHERKLIEENWAAHDSVVVDFLEKATIEALDRKVVENEYHVLHYMGHGDFDGESGLGMLILEGDEGEAVPVRADTLSVVLRKARKMRLIVLNACDTAKAAKGAGQDPFAGVAAALVMANVGEVVAMQFPISDRAAVKFAEKFYWSLASGFPLVAAVSEGRTAIKVASPDSMEWATPILFMRSTSDPFFKPKAPPVEPAPGDSGRDQPKPEKRDSVRPDQPKSGSTSRLLKLIGIPVVAAVIGFVLLDYFASPPDVLFGPPDLASIQWQNADTGVSLNAAAPGLPGQDLWVPVTLTGCTAWGPSGCESSMQILGTKKLGLYDLKFEVDTPEGESPLLSILGDSVSETQQLVHIRADSATGSTNLVATVLNANEVKSISLPVRVRVSQQRLDEAVERADTLLAMVASGESTDRALANQIGTVLSNYSRAFDELDSSRRERLQTTQAELSHLADEFDALTAANSDVSLGDKRKRLEAFLASSSSLRGGGSPSVAAAEQQLAATKDRMKSDVVLTDPAFDSGARPSAIELCRSVSSGKCTSKVDSVFSAGTVNFSLQYLNYSRRKQDVIVRVVDSNGSEVASTTITGGAAASRTTPGHIHGGVAVDASGGYTMRVSNASGDLLGKKNFRIQ